MRHNALRLSLLTALAATFCYAPPAAYAQTEDSSPALEWGGYLKTDTRVQTVGSNKVSWNEYRLDLNANLKTEQFNFHSEVWIRSLGFSSAATLEDLSSSTKVSGTRVDLREAYVEVSDFVLDGLDLRAGRQRIAWGRADKLNPTDNVNPYDLEDLWDFGRHLGSDALNLTYFGSGWSLSAVLMPTFTPAVLPVSGLSSALTASQMEPLQWYLPTIVPSFATNVTPLSADFKHQATAGARFSAHTIGIDWSLSYLYGREQLPVPVGIRVDGYYPLLPSPYTLQITYPRVSIVGFDLATSVGDAGFWFESAGFFPKEKTWANILIPWSSMFYPPVLTMNDKPYVKYVVGLDYTLPNDVYINLQFLHGFVHERDPIALHDYLFLRVEYTFNDGTMTFSPFSGGVEIGEPTAFASHHAFVYTPEFKYRPYDNFECALGARVIDGKGNATFALAKDYDEAYLQLKYSF